MTFQENVSAHVKLKPCPFCGGKPVINTRHWFGMELYEVACDECTASQGDMTDLEYAVERWNERYDPKEVS